MGVSTARHWRSSTKEVLNTLKDNNYKGIFIMQAYRDEDGLGYF